MDTVQQILEAEKHRNEIIQEAKRRQQQRVRQAQLDAEEEIKAHDAKLKTELEFENAKISAEINAKIKDLKERLTPERKNEIVQYFSDLIFKAVTQIPLDDEKAS